MCQAKEKGGKRCLRHAGATQAEVRYAWAKTGVDNETIYGILRDLNREGRKLEAPEMAEVKEFIAMEQFKTEHDPNLSERDKKLIQKNLTKALAEAESQSVSGGAFHAWKNLFAKTVEHAKNARKKIAAVGMAGLLAVSIAGCSGSLKDNEPLPTPDASDKVACSTENPGPWGDVVADRVVKDDLGEYCHTTIDPNSDALKYDASKVDMASLESQGFTEDDAKAAQASAVKLYAETVLDSDRLDNYSVSSEDWFAKNNSFVAPEWRETYAEALKDPRANGKGLSAYGILVTDVLPSPVARNGAPRASQTNIQVNKISAVETNVAGHGKTPALVVEIGSSSLYPASDSTIVSTIIKNDSSKTEESLKASNPELFDGSNTTDLLLQGNSMLAFGKGNTKQVTGISSSYTLSTDTGTDVAENGE